MNVTRLLFELREIRRESCVDVASIRFIYPQGRVHDGPGHAVPEPPNAGLQLTSNERSQGEC